MIPRKAVIAIVSAYVCLFIGVIVSFQYTNYVDRRSNHHWCGIIVLFDKTYKEKPPTTDTAKILAAEFKNLRKYYSC